MVALSSDVCVSFLSTKALHSGFLNNSGRHRSDLACSTVCRLYKSGVTADTTALFVL